MHVFSNLIGLNAYTARKPVVYVLWISTILSGFRIFIGCDQINFRGYTSDKNDNFLWKDDCHCKQGKFDPVCDSNYPEVGYSKCWKRLKIYKYIIIFANVFIKVDLAPF